MQLNPRTSAALYTKTAIILATLVMSYYATFFTTSSALVPCIGIAPAVCNRLTVNTVHAVRSRLHCSQHQQHLRTLYQKLSVAQAMLLSAAILGVSMAEVGVSIQHDANHGAFSNSTWVGAFLVRTPDVRGCYNCIHIGWFR